MIRITICPTVISKDNEPRLMFVECKKPSFPAMPAYIKIAIRGTDPSVTPLPIPKKRPPE